MPLVLLALLVLLAACGDGGDPRPDDPDARVSSLEVMRSVPTFIVAGDSLTDLHVRALDAAGHPVRGATVNFQATRSSRIGRTSTVTDSTGVASAGTWRMSTRPGIDSLVVTVGGGSSLGVSATIVAGPVYALEVMQRPTTGRVGEPMAPALVLRGRDQFGNPSKGRPIVFAVSVPGYPEPATVPAPVVLDDTGYVRVSGWVPRILGSHTLTATVQDVYGEQVYVTQQVDTPSCAPYATLLPTTAFGSRSGQLGNVSTQPCADSVDRWSLHLGATQLLAVLASGAPVRVQRAGEMGEATLLMPMHAPGTEALLLPAGDYEVVMGPRRAGDGVSYSVQVIPATTFACDTAWTTPGSTLRHAPACAIDRPDLALPAGSLAASFGVAAASLPNRALRVTVTAIPAAGAQLRRVLVVEARRRATGETLRLGALAATATDATLDVTVPAGWDDVVLLVGHQAGENGTFDLRIQ